MLPKPKGLAPEYGAQFRDRSVAEAYPHRPPYPAATFDVLAGLVAGGSGAVLDVGAGTGDIARRLAPLVARVDAVDASAAMIARGRGLPGGDAPKLVWIEGMVEEAALSPPYGLITAGESLHWFDWAAVFPRFAAALVPGGFLTIVGREWGTDAERERLHPIIGRYSTNRDFRPYNLLAELESRGLFAPEGQRRVGPEPWEPTIAEYLECRHSQNGLSRERMGHSAEAFDREMAAALRDLCREGALGLRDDRLVLTVEATITWGRPQAPPV
jgi:SAM-dependent methyltransferase